LKLVPSKRCGLVPGERRDGAQSRPPAGNANRWVVVPVLIDFLRANMKYAILGLIAALLVSCVNIMGHSTPTFSPAQTKMPKPSTTPTPIAAAAATTTLQPTLSYPSLPSWMSNPLTNILAAFITDDSIDSPRISFYNAANGEKYDINIPNDVRGYFWYDNKHFGFLSNDLKSIKLIDLTTGQTSENPLAPESLRLWNLEHENYIVSGRELVALEILHNDTNSEILLEQTGWYWNTKSKSKQFAAKWSSDDKAITVTDTKTNQVIWELTLPENRFGTEFVWSPVNENYLTFLQGSPEPLNGLITEEMTLTIVDVVEGKILSSYDGEFGILRWSPDAKMILYQNPLFRYRNYGFAFKDAPCILILGTGQRRCLRSIPRLVPTGYTLGTTGVYEWENDSNSVFYTYLYFSESKPQYEVLGNLCNYSIVDSHINCPTQALEALHGRSVIYYELSPDEQYIYFCYSASTILNDYASVADDGIIKVDGSGFFSWVGTILDGGFQTCSRDTLWRPLP
jgi:hypothetical protein